MFQNQSLHSFTLLVCPVAGLQIPSLDLVRWNQGQSLPFTSLSLSLSLLTFSQLAHFHFSSLEEIHLVFLLFSHFNTCPVFHESFYSSSLDHFGINLHPRTTFLPSLSLSLSLSLTLSLSLSDSSPLSFFLSLSDSFSLSLWLFTSFFLSLSLSLTLFPPPRRERKREMHWEIKRISFVEMSGGSLRMFETDVTGYPWNNSNNLWVG